MSHLSVVGLGVDFLNRGVATPAVRDLSFELESGQTLSIIGESGSGKSTLCLALLGLLPRQAQVRSGSAHFGDLDLLHCTSERLRAVRGGEIGMIFQNPRSALNPHMRIGEQFFETLRRHRVCPSRDMHRRCLEVLAETDLPAAALERYPHQFSGGQCQRVMIAQALLAHPKLLLADEPTTALDLLTQKRILDLLERLRRERGLGLIVVSHDLRVVARLAERVLVLKDGRLMERGSPSKLFHAPTHPYTRKLIGSIPRDAPAPRRAASSACGGVILQARDLTLSHRHDMRGRRLIVGRRLNFKLRDAEVMGLIGESGCGKTSLARALVGLLKPDSGEVICRDNIHRPQLVFQNPGNSLNPRLTIAEALGEILLWHRLASRIELERRIEDLLEMVGLPGAWRHRFPHQLSGGQQQRAAIARALAAEPEVLIADEPTSSLDVTVQEEILDLLCALTRSRRRSMILISHDMAVVRNRCDHVAIMKDGEIIERAATESLFTAPRRDYTRQLLSAALPLPAPPS